MTNRAWLGVKIAVYSFGVWFLWLIIVTVAWGITCTIIGGLTGCDLYARGRASDPIAGVSFFDLTIWVALAVSSFAYWMLLFMEFPKSILFPAIFPGLSSKWVRND